MKKVMLALCMSVSSICFANVETIEFACKENYQNKIDKMVAFSMIKLNSLETAKGSIYEAVMGYDLYMAAMERTYNEIREENKNDATFEITFNFEKFESPINELVRKLNSKKLNKNVTYEQVAQFILANKDNDTYCPNDEVINKKQLINLLKQNL
jgi:hypothetical protein